MKRTNFVLALVAMFGCASFVAWADGPEQPTPEVVEAVETPSPTLADTMAPAERKAACIAAIAAAIEKYQCRINVFVVVSADGNYPQIEIIPIQKEEVKP